MDARKFRRFAVQYPIAFSGDHIVGEGTVKNLSKDGGKVVSHRRIPDEACLALRVSLPIASYPIMTRYDSPLEVTLAVVRWSTGGEFGLEFISRAFPSLGKGEWQRGSVVTYPRPAPGSPCGWWFSSCP